MEKVFIVCVASFLVYCKSPKTSGDEGAKNTPTPKYAKGFWIDPHDQYKDVYVRQSADSSSSVLHYRLFEKGVNLPDENSTVDIQVPVANMVCTSTTHIPLLDYLGASEKLIGFPNTKYISSVITRKRIDDGLVEELGNENSINLERLIKLQPSVVMTYSLSDDLGSLKKAREVGIPVVINSEFLEHHPLGRAEWIKFMALFLGKEPEADSIFDWIELQYKLQQKIASGFSEKPTILTGIPYGGTWYLPGGQNYAARFFEDAGCNYLWRDNPSSGFLQLSLETVYQKASNADFWIGVGSFETFDELKAAESRFTNFLPFQNHKVYNYNKRIGPTGGNEYLELGYLRPDLILKDLIQITHTNEYPNPDLFFYKALK